MDSRLQFAFMAFLSKSRDVLMGSLCLLLFTQKSLGQTQLDLAGVSFAEPANQSGEFEAVLGLNHRFEKSFVNLKWKFEFEGDLFAATYPDFAFAVPQFRLKYSTKETEASFGRKKIKQINFLDEDWYLGVQTAFFRMDPFRPKEQGLLGFNYQINTDQVFVDFFVSPVFVPDQNPRVEVLDNGRVAADSPWVVLPPERIELNTGGVLAIDYSLVEDSLPELLNDHQFGGRFGINLKELSILGMYYNRPSRQLDFEVSAKVESGPEEGFVNVQAKPVFLREHFYGVQAESIWMKKLKVKNGFYGVIQQNNQTSQARFQTTRYDYFFISTGVEYNFKTFDFSLRHLMTNKKQIETEGVTYFENARFLFENAVAAEVSKLKFKDFRFKIGSVYSYKEETAQVYVRTQKRLGKSLSIYSFLNLIHDFSDASVEPEISQFTPQGIGRYASLDNIRLGVTYAF